MIKVKLKNMLLFTFFLMSFSLASSRAEAFLGLLPSTVMDPGALATQIINNVNAEINKYGTIANEQIKTTLNKIKSIKKKIENFINKRKSIKIPAKKKIVASQIADVKDPDSVSVAFKKLFFEYPSDQPQIMLDYRKKGREFYDDTLVEAFTVAREIEKNISRIDQKIIDAKENAKADDYLGGLQVLLTLNLATDEMLEIIEELIAIKMQMVAAEAVLDQVEPLYFGAPTTGLSFE